MHNKQVKICWNKASILHTIICIHILYKFCIQIVYIMFMMYTFCRSELTYTKCILNVYTKCIPHFNKLLYTKCIQNVCIQNVYHISTNICIYFVCKNLAGIVLLILCTKCIQKLVERFCTHQLHTSCTFFCIQNVYTVSVWDNSLHEKQ